MQFRLNFSSLILLAIIATLTGVSPAFAGSDYMNVTVNISSVSEITVLPTSLSWTAGNLGSITPGTDSTPQNILIKNTGSVNVSQLYVNTSTIMDENSNPLGVANASAYSSAGFIFLRNGTNTVYYHTGRLEWNLSRILTSEIVGTTGTSFGHGWYKNASGNDFLWKVVNGTNGLCNTTGTAFAIKTAPENNTAPITLSRDLTSGTTTCGSVTAGDAWGTFACSAGPLNEYCVATHYDCTKIHIYRYNKAADFPSCANSQYLQEDVIIPGDETYSVSLIASVPKGTPAGDAKLGMLTFIAS